MANFAFRMSSISLVACALISMLAVEHATAFSVAPATRQIISFRSSSQSSSLYSPSSSSSSSSYSSSSTALRIVPSRQKLKNLAWKSPEQWQVEEWLKQYGEVSRFYRRDVFTAADWVRARRPTRFFGTIRTTFQSGLLRQVKVEIQCLAVVSTMVVLFNNCVSPKFSWPLLSIPLVPFQLAAASLGLMLSFRTNASYQRWNEARTAWGKVINDSRSLARMACIWSTSYTSASAISTSSDGSAVTDDNDDDDKSNRQYQRQQQAKLLKRLGDAICSFSRTVMNRTLPAQEDENNFQLYCWKQLGTAGYGKRLLQAKHRPTAALAEITQLLVQLDFHPLHQVEIEKMVTELCSAMGACERIFTSPVPTFYPRHTARFLAFWLFLLPMALYEHFSNFWLVPVMSLLGAFLLGIEELANQMEEPFSILPMEKMTEGSIRVPVMEQVERSLKDLEGGTFVSAHDAADADGDYDSDSEKLQQIARFTIGSISGIDRLPKLPARANGNNEEEIENDSINGISGYS